MHMRFEFCQLGVDSVVERLSHAELDFLDTQIQVYQDRADADEQEIFRRNDAPALDLQSVESICSALVSNAKSSRAAPLILSAMQHVLLIPSNPIRRFYCVCKV